MMLTTKGRYAVMALVDVAINGKDKPVSLAEIAQRQEMTVPYLEQIFSKLKAADLVKSVRGPGGGYVLARQAEEIDIASIVIAADEQIKITRCNHDPANGCMSDKIRCLTHDLWDGLGNHIYDYLSSVSLSDVCNRTINTKPLFESDKKMGAVS